MDMREPSPSNAIDANKNGLIGKALDRVDGPLKVTGQATYAYEYQVTDNVLYGFIVESPIAKGKIANLDTTAAEQAPGVKYVMSYKNVPSQGKPGDSGPLNPPMMQFHGEDINHHGQPIALIVADSFENARAAASLIHTDYEVEKGQYLLAEVKDRARKPKDSKESPDSEVGKFQDAFDLAPVKVDVTYTTPVQSHAMMEPHATLAIWQEDKVTLYTSNQMISNAKETISGILKVKSDNVRIISHYIGGGFGSKLQIAADCILAALAARELKQPVKIALTRQQIFHVTTHRTDTIQRIRLGANPDGILTAIAHESWSGNLPDHEFYESAANQTRILYAAANRLTTHRLATIDLPEAASMRAPGEAVGLLALECAMDELAEKLSLDPIELRLRNEPAEDPEKHIPFSSRNLVACLKEGAQRFGWAKRNPVPKQVRDGQWLIGMGVASAIRNNMLRDATCKVSLNGKGILTIYEAMTDIGTGSYTILTQIGAELLGLDPKNVRVLIGDTEFPKTSGSGGSWGAGTAGSALYDACMKLRALLAKAAGIDPETAEFKKGQVTDGKKSASLITLVAAKDLEAEGSIKGGGLEKKYTQCSFGAHFAEVGVDSTTGEIRMRRMLGVFAAGRILNAKTARSQAIGAMTFGIGSALSEELAIDANYGYFVNHDLAEYHVPVHADIAQLDAVFLHEIDDKTNPLKSKGVGELGICGAGAAIANAVYNACGVRIRDYPLTLDKVIKTLET